jgi:hypothetical protein
MYKGRLVHELLQDYRAVLEPGAASSRPAGLVRKLRTSHRFVPSQGHHLDDRPELVFPLAVGQPEDSPVRADALDLETRGQGPRHPWLRLLHTQLRDQNSALIRTLTGHTSGVL